MHSFSVRCSFILCVLFVSLQSGTCLECYTCSSPSSGMCADDFSKSKVAALPCKNNENLCFKGSMTVLGVTVTTRACGSEDHCQLLENCYTCKENLCNASVKIVPSFILMSILGLLTIKFY